MSCEQARDLSLRRLLGEGSHQAKVDQHLSTCQGCQTWLKTMERTVAGLEEVATHIAQDDAATQASLAARVFDEATPLLDELAAAASVSSGPAPSQAPATDKARSPEATAPASRRRQRRRPVALRSRQQPPAWLIAAGVAAAAAILLLLVSQSPTDEPSRDHRDVATTPAPDKPPPPRVDPPAPETTTETPPATPRAPDEGSVTPPDKPPAEPEPTPDTVIPPQDEPTTPATPTAPEVIIEPAPEPPTPDTPEPDGQGETPQPDSDGRSTQGAGVIVVAYGDLMVEDAPDQALRPLVGLEQLAPGARVEATKGLATLSIVGQAQLILGGRGTSVRLGLNATSGVDVHALTGRLLVEHHGHAPAESTNEEAPGLRVLIADAQVIPVGTRFGVEMETRRGKPKQGTVWVEEGAVRVQADASSSVMVGPSQETTVREGQAATRPRPSSPRRGTWANDLRDLLFRDDFELIRDPRWLPRDDADWSVDTGKLMVTARPSGAVDLEARLALEHVPGSRRDARDDLAFRVKLRSQEWDGIGLAVRTRDISQGQPPEDEAGSESRGSLMIAGARRYVVRFEEGRKLVLKREGAIPWQHKDDPVGPASVVLAEARVPRPKRGGEVLLSLVARGPLLEVWLGRKRVAVALDATLRTGGVELVARHLGDGFDDVRIERARSTLQTFGRFNPADLSHEPGLGTADGAAWVLEPETRPNPPFVIYGPYDESHAPGPYMAVFEVTVPVADVLQKDLDTEVAVLDVSDGAGTPKLLSKRTLTLRDFELAAALAETSPAQLWSPTSSLRVRRATIKVSIPFLAGAQEKLEFRVKWATTVALRVETIHSERIE